jgi:peptidoglycan/xylan/chitin deacetylase (PgdA/CDA1 family)
MTTAETAAPNSARFSHRTRCGIFAVPLPPSTASCTPRRDRTIGLSFLGVALRYNLTVTLRRAAVGVLAGTVVLAASISADSDAGQPTPTDVAAEAPRRPVPQRKGNAAGVVSSVDLGDSGLTAPATFGFGTRTGFYPSDAPRELVLSFDDGPDLKFTPLVLDELDRRGLKAIFFVTGHRVIGDKPEDLARRELLGRIAAHGHLVANHTMTHQDLCRSPDNVAAEIDNTAEVIAQATGIRPMLFRAPYGARCRTLEAALNERQLISVGWNLDPQDWKNPTSEGILAYLEARLGRLKGRGILLLHDTHPASVFALGPLLDWIARENRISVRAGLPPIVLRDYGVFLPARPVPKTGIASVISSVASDVVASLTPRLVAPVSPIARR